MISLSHGTALDATPAALLRAAAAAGYGAAGLRLDPDEVDAAEAGRLRGLADDLGLAVLDVEVVRLGPRHDPERDQRLVELAAILGASFLLTVSEHEEESRTVDDLGRLGAQARAVGVRVGLEFMRFTSVRSLAHAVRLVDGVASAVVVDALHLQRAGESPEDLAAVPRHLLAYVQLCDAPSAAPIGDDDLAHEARHTRLATGEGALPLRALVSATPHDVPLTIEVQSDLLSSRLAPPERVAHLLALAHPYLSSH